MWVFVAARAEPIDLAACEDRSLRYEGADRLFACDHAVVLQVKRVEDPSLERQQRIVQHTVLEGKDVRWEPIGATRSGDRTRHVVAGRIPGSDALRMVVDLPSAAGTAYVCREVEGVSDVCPALVDAVIREPSRIPPPLAPTGGRPIVAGHPLGVDEGCFVEVDGAVGGSIRCAHATLSWKAQATPSEDARPKLAAVFADRAPRFTDCTVALPGPGWCTRLEMNGTVDRIWAASGTAAGAAWWVRCTDEGSADPLCRQLFTEARP